MVSDQALKRNADLIRELICDINNHGSISSIHLPVLTERLPILCRDFTPRRRTPGSIRRERKDNKQFCLWKKQHRAYWEIQSRKPGILLGFIIVASPNFCCTVKVPQFLEAYKDGPECLPNVKVESTLEAIAKKDKLSSTPQYQALIHALQVEPRTVPENEGLVDHISQHISNDNVWTAPDAIAEAKQLGLTPQNQGLTRALQAKPETVAENGGLGNRMYESAKWEGTRKAFGDELFNEMIQGEETPPHAPVTTWAPSHISPEDVIVELGIVNGERLGRTLFSSFDMERESHNPLDSEDDTELDIRRASIESFSIFPHRIRTALDASQLRAWEKDHCDLTKTDCVSMRWNRRHGWKLRLRVGCFAFLLILNELYGEES